MPRSHSRSDRSGGTTGLWRDNRGATLALAVAALGVSLGSTALVVDVGMLITARLQSERAAEAGAVAGAVVLAEPGAEPTEARARARASANLHTVLREPVNVGNADVDVDMTVRTVTVRVHRSVETFVARVFGLGEVDVSTTAAAATAGGGGEG